MNLMRFLQVTKNILVVKPLFKKFKQLNQNQSSENQPNYLIIFACGRRKWVRENYSWPKFQVILQKVKHLVKEKGFFWTLWEHHYTNALTLERT